MELIIAIAVQTLMLGVFLGVTRGTLIQIEKNLALMTKMILDHISDHEIHQKIGA